MTEIERIVNRCTRYWRRTRVPREAIAEMRMELESHLRDAVADGMPVRSVVGEDLEVFAERWAWEFRGPYVRPSLFSVMVPTILALLVGVVMFVFSTVIPVSTEAVTEVCCPWRVVERTVEPDPGGLFLVRVVLAVAVLSFAASVLLLVRRLTAASVALALGALAGALTPPTWLASLLLLVAFVWTQVVVRRAYRAATPAPA